MQEITSYGNMSEAFDRVLRGKKRKKCRQGRYLLAHREEVIAELTAKLADCSFRLGNYHERKKGNYLVLPEEWCKFIKKYGYLSSADTIYVEVND